MAAKTYTYILCKKYETEAEGRRIETTINLDTCKDFESFIKTLRKKSEISETDAEEFSTAYYT